MEGLSGNLWPIHSKPYQDELLSSWLVRLAHGNGLKLQTFCALVFGRDKQIWNRDIDKQAPAWLIEHLAMATGTTIADALNTTLKSYEGVVYESHQSNGNTKWITPLGIYHRVHKDFGLQFCPLCLAQDDVPYFRKQWRLAFYTECERHHILLHDRCPECGQPINFHRVEMGIRSRIKPRSVANCYKCDFDLRNAIKQQRYYDDWQVCIQYRSLLSFYDIAWSFTSDINVQYSHQILDVVRHLCILMSSHRKPSCLLVHALMELGRKPEVIQRTQTITFEKLTVQERNTLLYCSLWLIQKWPCRFIEICKTNHLSAAYLLPEYSNSPYWFYSIIDEYLNNRQYSPTNLEISNARAYLNKIGQRNGITNTSRLLGYSTLKWRSH